MYSLPRVLIGMVEFVLYPRENSEETIQTFPPNRLNRRGDAAAAPCCDVIKGLLLGNGMSEPMNHYVDIVETVMLIE